MKFKHPKKIKRTLAGLFTGIVMTLLLLLIPSSILTRAEYIFYDGFSKHESDKASLHSDDIFIVDIDENALLKYGPYNEWTRETHAKAVEKLEEGGAAAIAFDILFKTADFGTRNAVRTEKVLSALYPAKNWRYDFDKIRQSFDYDSILVRSIGENGNVIICGTFSVRSDYKHQSQWMPLSTIHRAEEIDAKPVFSLAQSSAPEKIEEKDLLDNIFPELSHASENFGVVNATPDVDGVIRKMRLLYRFPNSEIHPGETQKIYPALSLATLMHLFKTNPDSVRIQQGEYIDLGKPFAIYRDSLGVLRTTYPQITFPMIRGILSKKNLLLYEPLNDSLAENFIEISPQIRAEKDDEGNVTILTDEGDFEIGDEELTDYDNEVIRIFQPEIDSLKNGASIWLSASLDFRFSPQKKRWVSNYSILSPDVLTDLFALDLATIYELKPGEEIRLGKRKRIPINNDGDFILRYKSAYNIPQTKRTYQHLSYYDVIEGRIPPETYQGKIFILGSAAPAMFDFYAVPQDDHFPAVLVHATIIDNILNDEFTQADFPHPAFYAIAAIFAILIGLFAPQYLALIFLLVLIFLNIIVSYYFFSNGYYIGCATYIIECILAFFGSFLVRFYFENRDKNFLDKSFKQYVSNELIDQMLNREELPKLGGEKKYLTAYFTDIQGFSSFSEQIGDPEKLVVLLNSYLTAMTNIIKEENQGTLDKYEGDAIIAFFGAPTPLQNQRRHAILSAISMQKKQKLLREKWKAEMESGKDFWPESVYKMHTRIGINSGEIVVGNMGSETRKNYTMMGDSVNLASRLESIGKQYGVYILVSEEVLTGTHDPEDKTDYRGEFVVRPIDKLRVVGKTEPVQVYEILGEKTDADAGALTLLSTLWQKAQAFYFAEKWDDAIAVFEETKLLEPHLQSKDPGARPTPSEVFIARCFEYKMNPPEGNGKKWDGVYVAKNK
ncbi:MAG: adenylate/guanylate cyclase domain-containing protein [Hallerella sp.]|uniref:adenylate/guanylate cyclase domain-containing protein n=1 Tax=Hallerella sp. TaxID=2815812 RepID=UPI0025864DD0|nr:adenylate/guanylate cyclase domain-containing protein [Hallerella sp.]MCI5601682.1 adenylate/guanylate cyclase domain-containing protein [Hallerella sp.]